MIKKVKEGKIKHIKKKLFETYLLWCSLPNLLKKMSLERAKNLGFDMKNKLLRELLVIETDTDFSHHFDIHINTLCHWKQEDGFKKRLNKILTENVLRLKKDIDIAFTEKTIKESDAPRVKLWKQLFEGWQEKETKELTGDLGKLLVEISESKKSPVNR